MDLAAEEINASGGINGTKIQLIYEDSQADPKTATSALQKLINDDRVPAVVGDIASSCVLAMAPLAERSKVVLLSPGASTPEISQAGQYVFRNWQSDALEGDVDGKYAFNHLKWRRAACVYVNNASGTGLSRVFKTSFEAAGGQVPSTESFAENANDVRTQIAHVLAAKPDGIFLPGYPKGLVITLRQLKEAGSHIPILATQAFDDPTVYKNAGAAAEGVIFSTTKPPDPKDPTVSHFKSAYLTNSRYAAEYFACNICSCWKALASAAWYSCAFIAK